MKIVFLDTDTLGKDVSLEKLKTLGEVKFYGTTSPNERLKNIADAEVVITNKVILDKEILSQTPKLKLICVAATGVNNIDIEYAQQRNIEVKNAANYSTHSVAQATFAHILHLLHHIRYYDKYVKEGNYSKSPIFTHIARSTWELNNKIFGIIGLGSIGETVANIATAFGSKVIYYSTSGKNNNQKYQRVTLDELLSSSNIVSIHAALNKKTKNLITYNTLKIMQKNAILVNMGRGGIINETDLARAIDEEIISSVGIDVLEQEPINSDNPLLKIKNKNKILITPHIAWASIEARNRLINIIFEHIQKQKFYDFS